MTSSHRRPRSLAAPARSRVAAENGRDVAAAAEPTVEQTARWTAAFDRAPFGMGVVNLEGRLTAVNPALCELLRCRSDDLSGRRLRSFATPVDQESDLAQMQRALTGEVEAYELEHRYLRPDRSEVWVLVHFSLVRDVKGDPAYFVVHLQDITERKAAEVQLTAYAEHLHVLASQDPVTGLCDYRTFHERLETELLAAHRERLELSLVLLTINSGMGGKLEGGDNRMLEAAAAAICGACRSSDVCARTGPAEFAMILPETGAESARNIASRVRSEGRQLGLASISFGVATTRSRVDPMAFLLRADAQLREAPRDADDIRPETPKGGRLQTPTERIQVLLAVARRALASDAVYLIRHEVGRNRVLALIGDPQLCPDFLRVNTDADDAGSPSNGASTPTSPSSDSAPAADSALTGGKESRCVEIGVVADGGDVTVTLCSRHRSCSEDRSEDGDLELLGLIGGLVAKELDAVGMTVDQMRQREELAGMNALVSALSARDRYTGDHSRTVVGLAVAVARRMRLAERMVRQIEQVALLHDIGKVGVPDSILQKNGPLTAEEWRLMREHPAIGARILAGTQTLAHLAPAVLAEHERFDGMGYPFGLRGSAIPIASRITLACDAYDAMTTDRPYRLSLGPCRAQQELADGAGTQFDPAVVEALLEVIDEGCRSAEP